MQVDVNRPFSFLGNPAVVVIISLIFKLEDDLE